MYALAKRVLPLVALLVAAASADSTEWPQFHGPNRDNKSLDKGLLKAWPAGGPKRLWKATGIGEGYSNVSLAKGRVHTTGSIDGKCVITALDGVGKKVWARANGKAWSGSYPGTRSTLTITPDGLLYHLSGVGSLACLKAADGEPVWSVDIMRRFGGRKTTWGLAESPLVFDDKVICTPGGRAAMAALDRKTGEAVWQCKGTGDRPGYASPILIEHKGLRLIVTAMSEAIVGVRAKDGKLLWRYPHKVYADENITTPLFHDGFVIVSGCGRKGTTSLRLDVSGDECSVARHWINPTLDNKQGSIVLVDGRIYGYAEQLGRSAPWMCIDFRTGKTVFTSARVKSSYKWPNECLTYADGMFYLYSDDGKAALAKATDKGFVVTGTLQLSEPGKRQTWAHPVVCGGRLYLRHGNALSAFDVRAKK